MAGQKQHVISCAHCVSALPALLPMLCLLTPGNASSITLSKLPPLLLLLLLQVCKMILKIDDIIQPSQYE
jgi:hypothetical protein